ncbi:hypothetical protein K2X33_14265 [bacterium]|nr:hypothetical protein [bacterium]
MRLVFLSAAFLSSLSFAGLQPVRALGSGILGIRPDGSLLVRTEADEVRVAGTSGKDTLVYKSRSAKTVLYSSPSARHLVFVEYEDLNGQRVEHFSLRDTKTGKDFALEGIPRFIGSSAWNAKETILAYVSRVKDVEDNVYLLDIEGLKKDAQAATPKPAKEFISLMPWPRQGNRWLSHLSFSPSGEYLAYHLYASQNRNFLHENYLQHIDLAPTDPGVPRVINTQPAESLQWLTEDRILSLTYTQADGWNLYSFNSDGSAFKKELGIRPDPTFAVSPDGSLLVYRPATFASASPFTVRDIATGDERLMKDSIFAPRFSADGAFLYYQVPSSDAAKPAAPYAKVAVKDLKKATDMIDLASLNPVSLGVGATVYGAPRDAASAQGVFKTAPGTVVFDQEGGSVSLLLENLLKSDYLEFGFANQNSTNCIVSDAQGNPVSGLGATLPAGSSLLLAPGEGVATCAFDVSRLTSGAKYTVTVELDGYSYTAQTVSFAAP